MRKRNFTFAGDWVTSRILAANSAKSLCAILYELNEFWLRIWESRVIVESETQKEGFWWARIRDRKSFQIRKRREQLRRKGGEHLHFLGRKEGEENECDGDVHSANSKPGETERLMTKETHAYTRTQRQTRVSKLKMTHYIPKRRES